MKHAATYHRETRAELHKERDLVPGHEREPGDAAHVAEAVQCKAQRGHVFEEEHVLVRVRVLQSETVRYDLVFERLASALG